MENYSYSSYPESGDSSPRSREIDFDNPPPWEDQQHQLPPNYKVKFMCSYGGKIHPRPHDNQLAYMGGETKIFAVERSVKFPNFIAKLSALAGAAVPSDISFKYQLPGEDLDALISVTNDDDLEHMMTEYDRLYRASPKPARLRLFLFSIDPPPPQTAAFSSRDGKSDRDRFVDALNSGPAQPDSVAPPPQPPSNNVDFLFGLEKGNPVNHHLPTVKMAEVAAPEPDIRVGPRPGLDRVSSPEMIPVDIQRHIQDLQRLQLQDQAAAYRRKSEENVAGEIYLQKMSEKPPLQGNIPGAVAGTGPPPGYWPEKHLVGGGGSGGFPGSLGEQQQQVYMIPAPTGMYHAPPPRPVTAQATQGYYQVQRMGSDVYREQQQQQQQHQPPQYSLFTAPPPPQPAAPPQQAKMAAYSEGISMMRPVGVGSSDVGYAQAAYDSAGRQVYDSAGRQVYYTAPGSGVIQAGPYPAAMVAASADTRVGPIGPPSQESKMSAKISQTSM